MVLRFCCSGLHVLWWNYEFLNGSYAGCAVAVSPTPDGEYTNTSCKGCSAGPLSTRGKWCAPLRHVSAYYDSSVPCVPCVPCAAGPFKMANPLVNITRGRTGDFDLFVDDDGTGYVIYSWNFVMSIEQLTPDFLYSSGNVATPALFPDYFVEAPTFVRFILVLASTWLCVLRCVFVRAVCERFFCLLKCAGVPL